MLLRWLCRIYWSRGCVKVFDAATAEFRTSRFTRIEQAARLNFVMILYQQPQRRSHRDQSTETVQYSKLPRSQPRSLDSTRLRTSRTCQPTGRHGCHKIRLTESKVEIGSDMWLRHRRQTIAGKARRNIAIQQQRVCFCVGFDSVYSFDFYVR